MAYTDLKKRYNTLCSVQKAALWSLAVLSFYILDAWLLGSATLMFRDWDLMLRCFSNPFSAAITVPRRGSITAWFLLNVLFLLSLAMILYALYMRYPEILRKMFPKKA